jgi:hypothetical protein
MPQSNIDEKMEEMQVRLEEAKYNIVAAQMKRKENYDAKHSKPNCFQEGEKVLKKDFTRKKRKGGKLVHWFPGPFTIKKLPHGVYQLTSHDGKDVRSTGAHLKPYVEPDKKFQKLNEESLLSTLSNVSACIFSIYADWYNLKLLHVVVIFNCYTVFH